MKYYVRYWGETSDDAEDFDTGGHRVIGAEQVKLYLDDLGEELHCGRLALQSDWPIDVTVIDDNGTEFQVLIDKEIKLSFSGKVL